MRSRLLIIVHQIHNRGGVELSTRMLARDLAPTWDVFLAYRRADAVCCLSPDGREQAIAADPVDWPFTPYRAPHSERALEQVLATVRPHLVHVQHFHGWPLSVLDQIAAHGSAYVVSLHDFYAITPEYTMRTAASPSETTGAAYALRTFGRDVSAWLRKRQAVIGEGLARARRRVVPSAFLRDAMTAVFGGAYPIIPYGIEAPAAPARPSPPPAGRLRFGYLGTLLPQKGWETLYEAFPAVREKHPEVTLTFFGGREAPASPPAGVRFAGVYDPSDLDAILADIDIGVIPSTFAETYSIVLSEMWARGVPVAVSDIGALGQRVTDGVNGRLFPAGDANALARVLCTYIESDDWRAWTFPPVPRAVDTARAYDALFREVIEEAKGALEA